MINDWRLRSLIDFHCYMNTEEDNKEWSKRDKQFMSETARKTFEAFTARAVKHDDDTSRMHLIRADASMTAFLEDTKRKLAGIKKEGHEPFVLRNMFSSLPPKAVENMQLEVL